MRVLAPVTNSWIECPCRLEKRPSVSARGAALEDYFALRRCCLAAGSTAAFLPQPFLNLLGQATLDRVITLASEGELIVAESMNWFEDPPEVPASPDLTSEPTFE